jgi:hypothetical protein
VHERNVVPQGDLLATSCFDGLQAKVGRSFFAAVGNAQVVVYGQGTHRAGPFHFLKRGQIAARSSVALHGAMLLSDLTEQALCA